MGTSKWDAASIAAEAKHYTQPTEFRRGSHGAYVAAQRLGILDEVCKHMTFRRKLTKEHVLNVARSYKTRVDFARGAESEYGTARKNGYLDEACAHMQRKLKWTESSVAAEAAKYTKRYDFELGSPNAYSAAKRLGIYDQVCSHMEYSKRHRLTLTEIRKIAKTYKTRKEFQTGDTSAYNCAIRNEWLDSVCAHMERGATGFNNDKPGTLYQILLTTPTGTRLWKIGITNGPVTKRLASMGVPRNVHAEVVCTVHFQNGKEARQLETKLHARGKRRGVHYQGEPILRSGNTELFLKPLIKLT
ncbi:hypothetical protein BcepSauron_125 [Burkholderia phage BcepSauron]|uniref:Uncharacterized protein n=2 Tax=Sarumanvirus TaxID=2843450 RepID=A0A482MLK5_9CAUD|nr:hypothetical protein H1O16_gp126 [Burkholderia phage BcepSaruman]YP_009904503.1 hypothetical protein H1O17_gp125 [Burkholderia phage BcepSauron]QBQ74505.1 hypothetical protein BcepSauron_125 [Burkholderia phage BcepSauron]QBX06539.1 hypothetical protein BcepSaruman_126 [Burkholderia phage BcepSaruman]